MQDLIELFDLIENVKGKVQLIRYEEVIDALTLTHGDIFTPAAKLIIAEAENVEPMVAIHTLNTLLIDTTVLALKQMGIFVSLEEELEENMFKIFEIYVSSLRLITWELHDQLLNIMITEETDELEKFYNLMNEVGCRISEDDVLMIIESVEDFFFENLEEDINNSITSLNAMNDLTPEETLVYIVPKLVKEKLHLLNKEGHVSLSIRNRKPFHSEVTEFIHDGFGLKVPVINKETLDYLSAISTTSETFKEEFFVAIVTALYQTEGNEKRFIRLTELLNTVCVDMGLGYADAGDLILDIRNEVKERIMLNE